MPDSPLKHIVVLMMENRSFDHILGFLKGTKPDLRGVVADDYVNFDRDGNPVGVTTGAAYQGQLGIDPGHEFDDVHAQMYGAASGTDGAQPTMSGFVRNYEQLGGNGPAVMLCFKPEQLPATTALARSYVVCDQWFSSVPGPTLPNRAFAHFGTSFGRLDMSPDYFRAKASIYQRLEREGKTGRIYYYSTASSTLGLSFLLSDQNRYFRLWGDFKKDCANNTLPDYAFIEPNYGEGGGTNATDQHPDHSVREGDSFIKQVYKAISSNADVWKSTVLLIVWDEHGGLFDHEIPPIVSHPDGFFSNSPRFTFDRLGVRVPAIVVSPYVTPGFVDHHIYEHASIPATVTERFIGDPRATAPYGREQYANTFLHLLHLDQVPADPIDIDHAAPAPGPADAAQSTANDPASTLHIDQVREIYAVLVRSHPVEARGFDPATVVTEGDAAGFIKRAIAIIDPAAAAREGVGP